MLLIPSQRPVYLLVDALDECPNNSGMPTPREEVLDLLDDIVNLRLPSLHICVTSRPEIDIRTILEPLTSLRVSVHNQSGQQQDIVNYINSVVHSDKKMRRWREEDKRLVIETLSERADGMYVFLSMPLICQIYLHIGSDGCIASWKHCGIVSLQVSEESLMDCLKR